MRWWVGLSALLAIVVVATSSSARPSASQAAAGDCMDNPLGPLPGYSAITSGDFTQENTEADGRVVAGGNFRMTNGGVATKLTVDRARIDLATGAGAKLTNTGVNNGSVTYGSTITPANFTVPNGTVTKAAPPFNVPALFDGLVIRSTSWAALDVNGTTGTYNGGLELTGTSRVRNVFRLTDAQLANRHALYLHVPDGSTTLITYAGGGFQNGFDGGMFLWDEATGYTQLSVTAPNQDLENRRRAMLWNFPNAVSVTLGPPATGWQGTVLAPRASVQLTYQHIFGSIAAASITGTGEIGAQNPNPCLPDPTPCPQPSPTPSPTSTPTTTPTRTPTTTPTVIPTVSPTPTATPLPTPSPTPTRTPTPTPLPTVSPGPIVTPTPTPDTVDPSEPLTPDQDADEVVVEGGSAEVSICKKVMTPKGRAVDEMTVKAGATVKFRIRVTNLGTDVARNVVVCDLVPSGLTLVRATVKVSYRNGRPCVTIPLLTGQREGFVWMRVSRSARGKITNVAAVTSREGGRRTNPATIHVVPISSTGGVTG